jgi:hypothetical protein
MKKRFFGEEKRRYQSVGTWVRKGSATMEYIILIAVGALFAGLLYLAMSDGEGLIQSAMEKRVQEIIQGRLPEGEVPPEKSVNQRLFHIITHRRLAIPEKSVDIGRLALLLMPAFRRSWKGPPLDPARLRRMGTRKRTGRPLPSPGVDQGVQTEMLPHLHPHRSPRKRAGFPDGGKKRKTTWPPDKS